MKKKVVSADTHILDENWQLLADAICVQAVRDFEYMISDKPRLEKYAHYCCNLEEVKRFAKKQNYTGLDMSVILKIVEKNYKEKFRPLVAEKGEEIERNWKRLQKRGVERKVRAKDHPYRCPNCGGLLYPCAYKVNKQTFIICDGCCLNARIIRKEERERCTT